MSDDLKPNVPQEGNPGGNNDLTRRQALKGLAIGMGASLPILGQQARANDDAHAHHKSAAATTQAKAGAPKFFSAAQMALIATISEHIIPTDSNSKGAIAAEVPAFIDLMISESPAEAKKQWTDGLAAMDKMSQAKFSKPYHDAAKDQQIQILTEISKNEMKPVTVEEKFFKAI
ncbi:MAG: gluconate 2-dehydrogenase subunit 3 family protein, partial [Blastocatellia bacterium]